jgi:hypothetical protein
MTRDVSSRGISFVCPEEVTLKEILVGLHVNEKDTKWFFSEIMRSREIGDTGFWEHAVEFKKSVAL